MNTQKNIVLIGMPAAGKSTVGIILAKKLGLQFVDTDVLIQTKERRLLPEIIREEGLDGFCRIEESHLLSFNESGHVIATGGSVIYGSDAMAHLKQNGIVVYLETTVAILESRIIDPSQRGVIKKPGQTIGSLFEERDPLYRSFADIVIRCDQSESPVQTADMIRTALSTS